MKRKEALLYPQAQEIAFDNDDENVYKPHHHQQQQSVSVLHRGQDDSLCRNFNAEFDRIAMASGNGHGTEKTEEECLGFHNVRGMDVLQKCSQQQAHEDQIAAFRSKWGYDVVHDCPVMGTVWNWEVLVDCDPMQRYNPQAVPM